MTMQEIEMWRQIYRVAPPRSVHPKNPVVSHASRIANAVPFFGGFPTHKGPLRRFRAGKKHSLFCSTQLVLSFTWFSLARCAIKYNHAPGRASDQY